MFVDWPGIKPVPLEPKLEVTIGILVAYWSFTIINLISTNKEIIPIGNKMKQEKLWISICLKNPNEIDIFANGLRISKYTFSPN